MEKILELSREIGHLIQNEDCYKDYVAAKKANDSDEDLQKWIGEFNIIKLSLDSELSKEEKDEAKLKSINEDMRKIYSNIMANESMQKFQSAKMALDKLVAGVYNVVSGAAGGLNPDDLTLDDSCSGDCSSCGGCH